MKDPCHKRSGCRESWKYKIKVLWSKKEDFALFEWCLNSAMRARGRNWVAFKVMYITGQYIPKNSHVMCLILVICLSHVSYRPVAHVLLSHKSELVDRMNPFGQYLQSVQLGKQTHSPCKSLWPFTGCLNKSILFWNWFWNYIWPEFRRRSSL